jgi:hypothetical protein
MGQQSPDSEFAAGVAKDLERRWGLSLVSFVPAGSAAPLLGLRQCLRETLDRRPATDEPVIEFYDLEQLHCTQLTLARSSAWGPVRQVDFVKAGVDPQELSDIVARETAGLGEIRVRLDRLVLSAEGLLLYGGCADDDSTARRCRLLDRLNTELPRYFNVGRRSWDTDPARYGRVHMRLGFAKRRCVDCESLVADVATSSFEPITVTFPDVVLVHHRYRTLRGPHAGSLRFPLDDPAGDRAVPPIGQLNLG